MTHQLKIEPQYLENLLRGKKKVEIRRNDRDYQVGDILEFWDTEKDKEVFFRVTHIHSGLGMQEYYVALSVEKVK